MVAINFIGIPLLILFVAALVLFIVGLVTRRARLWKVSLWVLAGVTLLYLVFFVIFR